MFTKQNFFTTFIGIGSIIIPIISFSAIDDELSIEKFIGFCMILVLLQLTSIFLVTKAPKLGLSLSILALSFNIPLTVIVAGLVLTPFQKTASLLICFNTGLYLLNLSFRTKTSEDKKSQDI